MEWREFVEVAIRVPFAERGRDYEGWDCYGLVLCAYRDVIGIELPSYSDRYATTTEHRALVRAILAGKALWKRVDDPREGDVAVILRKNLPIHVGIVLAHDTVIHAEERIGTVIEPLEQMRVEGHYRHSDVT